MARLILSLGAGAQTADVAASALQVASVQDAVEAANADAVIVSVPEVSRQTREELLNTPGVDAVHDDLQGIPLVADEEEVEDFLNRVRNLRGEENAPQTFETRPLRNEDDDGEPMTDGGAQILPVPQRESGPESLSEGPIESADDSVNWTGARILHDQGITGDSVIAVVVDTGSCASAYRDDRMLEGADLTGDDDPWTPLSGHGGMTMGIMAGDENTPGIDVGFLPDADVFPIKTTLAASELMQAQDIITGLAEENPEKTVIVNNSWGFPECSGICDHPVTTAVRSAAEHPDVVQVIAAGNEGGEAVTKCGGECDGSTPGISGPNSLTELVTVAATGNNGRPETVQPYSSRGGPGEVSCGEHKPDLAAPTFGRVPYECSARDMGNGGGTSAACPQVAGAIGLIADAKGSISTATVTRGLSETAAPVTSGGFDGCSGEGNIQVDTALDVTDGDNGPSVPVDRDVGDTIGVVAAGAGLAAVVGAVANAVR